MYRERLVFFKLAAVLVLAATMPPAFTPDIVNADVTPISVNHTSTDITKIPQAAIVAAKENLHIAYGCLSHGTQLINGMTGLVAFANGLSLPTDIFAWSYGGGDGFLDFRGGATGGVLSNYPDWVEATEDYLDDYPEINVIIWCWCGEVPGKYEGGTLEPEYLTPMKQLETDYPGVTFVYMTGHLDHGNDASLKAGNQAIRDYFSDNDTNPNRALYDFADIESWNPDGTYYEFADDACNYYNSATNTTALGNWAEEWRASHTLNQDWYYWVNTSGDPGDNVTTAWHTDCLNGNLKAYAAWSLWARLAGWDGTPNSAPVADDQEVSTSQDTSLPITLTATDADGDGPYLTYSIVTPPTHGSLSAGSSNSSITYTPATGYTGDDSFTFKTNDGHLDSNTATVSITVGVPTVISITISGAAAGGIDFGSQSPGAMNVLETHSGEYVPSINVTVENDTMVNVDLQVSGEDFGTGFTIASAKYSTTYAGTKTAMDTTYTTFAPDIAPGESASLWHWLTVPSSGVSAGNYNSTFSYKAIEHQP